MIPLAMVTICPFLAATLNPQDLLATKVGNVLAVMFATRTVVGFPPKTCQPNVKKISTVRVVTSAMKNKTVAPVAKPTEIVLDSPPSVHA